MISSDSVEESEQRQLAVAISRSPPTPKVQPSSERDIRKDARRKEQPSSERDIRKDSQRKEQPISERDIRKDARRKVHPSSECDIRKDARRKEQPSSECDIRKDSQRVPTEEDFSRTFREGLYEALLNLMDDDKHQNRSMGIAVVMLIITFMRFVAGAAKLSSDCWMEKNVAVYLFVKSWPGFVFWFTILLLVYKRKIDRAFKNWFFEIYFAINTLFAFIWLVVGCSWIFGRHKDIIEECPLIYSGYSDDFIKFAIVLTSFDLFVCSIVMILLLFNGCFKSNHCI